VDPFLRRIHAAANHHDTCNFIGEFERRPQRNRSAVRVADENRFVIAQLRQKSADGIGLGLEAWPPKIRTGSAETGSIERKQIGARKRPAELLAENRRGGGRAVDENEIPISVRLAEFVIPQTAPGRNVHDLRRKWPHAAIVQRKKKAGAVQEQNESEENQDQAPKQNPERTSSPVWFWLDQKAIKVPPAG
jgi:hypothetical protein